MNRAVADHRNRLARPCVRGHGGEPTGAEDIRSREQRRNQRGVGLARRGDESAVRQGDAGVLRLSADAAHPDPMHAVALISGPADLARVVGGDEGSDDEVADLDEFDVRTDLGDDAGVFVPHGGVVDVVGPAVGPQVRHADAGGGQLDDRVGRFDDAGHRPVLNPDVPGCVHDNSTHGGVLLRL
jgi:hypothetical protein